MVKDWDWIGGLVMDWQIGNGLADWHWIGRLVLDWQIGIGLADRYWIGRLAMDWYHISELVGDWQWIDIELAPDWKRIGNGLATD